MIAGIELGGTRTICALATAPTEITGRIDFQTGSPAETLARIRAFLAAAPARPSAIGIASFGPLDLDPASPSHGAILRTPKPGWSGANLRAALAQDFACPVAIDTDVNAAGRAEFRYRAGSGIPGSGVQRSGIQGTGSPSLAYVTIGTGIGGGLIRDGTPLHGLSHPEIGHIHPRRHQNDRFPGICPFHGDCLEGLASGLAIRTRAGADLSQLPPDHECWAFEADYLGQLCAMLALAWSPHRIVLGGGVPVHNPTLFPLIPAATRRWLGGYTAPLPETLTVPATFIVPPVLGRSAGIVGALGLVA